MITGIKFDTSSTSIIFEKILNINGLYHTSYKIAIVIDLHTSKPMRDIIYT
jgi:hypothetical protein